MSPFRLACLIILMLILAGCAASPDTAGDKTARPVVALEAVNRDLFSCKGVGRVEIINSGRRQHLRIAWTSLIPEKLRLAVLGPDGRPLATVSHDGRWVYFLDHTTGEFHKNAPDGYRLKAAMRLPMDPRSLALILAGRVPQFDYDRTEVSTGQTGDRVVVVLKKWRNRVAQVTVGRVSDDTPGPAIYRIKTYRQTGEVRYVADIKAFQTVAQKVVPKVLSIAAGDDRVVLDIERYWVNAPVKPDVFVLQPPR